MRSVSKGPLQVVWGNFSIRPKFQLGHWSRSVIMESSARLSVHMPGIISTARIAPLVRKMHDPRIAAPEEAVQPHSIPQSAVAVRHTQWLNVPAFITFRYGVSYRTGLGGLNDLA